MGFNLINVHHNPWHLLILHACTCIYTCTCSHVLTYLCMQIKSDAHHALSQTEPTAMLLCCVAMSLGSAGVAVGAWVWPALPCHTLARNGYHGQPMSTPDQGTPLHMYSCAASETCKRKRKTISYHQIHGHRRTFGEIPQDLTDHSIPQEETSEIEVLLWTRELTIGLNKTAWLCASLKAPTYQSLQCFVTWTMNHHLHLPLSKASFSPLNCPSSQSPQHFW